MSKVTSVVLGMVLFTSMASGCISVHKKETKEVPNTSTTIEHRTIVEP